MCVWDPQGFHCRTYFLARDDGAIAAGGRQDDREFFTTEACAQISRTHCTGFQGFGDLLQYEVAGHVAIGVVVQFEVIDIDQQY
ncbi:hypothetical protein D3C81_2090400 [compost metagenome]